MIRPLLGKIKRRVFPPPQVVVHYNCYSQAGEDQVLSFLFQSMGITRPSYIDIGAYKPEFGSNTYLFYLQGSRGVCIEPDPRLFQSLQEGRRGDTCLNMAVSFNGAREVEFYFFDEPSLNTTSYEEAKRRDEIGEYHLVDSRIVPAIRIEEVIQRHFSGLPDFISLDVEGADFEILAAFDFANYPVPVWVVETVRYSVNHIKEKVTSIAELMESRGYFVYADTYINTIFVETSWFFNYARAK